MRAALLLTFLRVFSIYNLSLAEAELSSTLRYLSLHLTPMELQTLQERVRYIETKRTWLRGLLADPQHSNLAIDINQALIELEDLAAEFDRTFPNGVEAAPPNT
jgi:hypothetical protein